MIRNHRYPWSVQHKAVPLRHEPEVIRFRSLPSFSQGVCMSQEPEPDGELVCLVLPLLALVTLIHSPAVLVLVTCSLGFSSR